MLTTTPEHIADHEADLLDAGFSMEQIDALKAHIELIAVGRANTNEITINDSITRVVDIAVTDLDTLSPKIKSIMIAFANRYHAYIGQYEAVIAANRFRKDLISVMSSIPEAEAQYMAQKIITSISHIENISPNTIYREVLQLIIVNPKKISKPKIFHVIIDMYVQKILSEKAIRHQDSAYAWISLDTMARVLMTDKEFAYHAKSENLTPKGRGIQRALRNIVKGIQTRNTAMIRKGIEHNFLKNQEIGSMADELLSNIEKYIH